MSTIFEIFNQLAADNSRLAKEKILRQNLENETLKRVFNLSLNPHINFYIKKIPNFTSASVPTLSLETALDKLFALKDRKVTGNAGISYLSDILSNLSLDDAQVIVKIIQKDCKCGVSTETVNKIWPNLIPIFPIMLASGYEEKLLKKINFPAYAQTKADGMRVNVVVDQKLKTVNFFTRNGKLLDLYNVLDIHFLNLASDCDYSVVFDGELLIQYSSNILDRKTGNGILNKAIKGTISEKEIENITMTMWDMFPAQNLYTSTNYNTPYDERFKKLSDLITSKPSKHYTLIDNFIVTNITEAQEKFQEQYNKGFEGIILKNLRSIWANERSKEHIKFKAELECDLEIIGVELGTPGSKYANVVGAIVAASSDRQLITNVGSGFSDDLRLELLKQSPIGKIATIKYNEKIIDKNGNPARLFLPTLIEIREDKIIADKLEDIK